MNNKIKNNSHHLFYRMIWFINFILNIFIIIDQLKRQQKDSSRGRRFSLINYWADNLNNAADLLLIRIGF
jgi:hypothetical protein